MSSRDPLSIDLALQGGGSHGAFTWGVLERVLDEPPRLEVEARPGVRGRDEAQQRGGEPAGDGRRQPAVVPGQLVGLVRAVPREQLVPAVPAQCHRDLLAGQFAEVVRRHHGRVRERFVEDRRDLLDHIGRLRFDQQFRVVGAQMPGHQRGLAALVVRVVGETDGECPQLGVWLGTPGGRHDRARIHPAAEEEAEWYVGDELPLDVLDEQPPQYPLGPRGGEVVALGKDVEGLTKGDLVSVIPLRSCGHCAACLAGEVAWCESFGLQGGGYAEYALTQPNQCVKLPSSASLADGAIIEPLAVALHGVIRAQLKPGAKVLVLGAGPIGLAVAFWARRLGAGRVVVQDVARRARGRRARINRRMEVPFLRVYQSCLE